MTELDFSVLSEYEAEPSLAVDVDPSSSPLIPTGFELIGSHRVTDSQSHRAIAILSRYHDPAQRDADVVLVRLPALSMEFVTPVVLEPAQGDSQERVLNPFYSLHIANYFRSWLYPNLCFYSHSVPGVRLRDRQSTGTVESKFNIIKNIEGRKHMYVDELVRHRYNDIKVEHSIVGDTLSDATSDDDTGEHLESTRKRLVSSQDPAITSTISIRGRHRGSRSAVRRREEEDVWDRANRDLSKLGSSVAKLILEFRQTFERRVNRSNISGRPSFTKKDLFRELCEITQEMKRDDDRSSVPPSGSLRRGRPSSSVPSDDIRPFALSTLYKIFNEAYLPDSTLYGRRVMMEWIRLNQGTHAADESTTSQQRGTPLSPHQVPSSSEEDESQNELEI